VVSASTGPDRRDLGERVRSAAAAIGIEFEDERLLQVALTHSSYANEHPELAPETNERLEFLGDAVLGLVIAETLYARYPEQPEGRLTEWRAQLVMGPTLARVAGDLGLGASLLLGRGEEGTGGRERERNLERVYEAIVGAIMLDQGLEAARAFIARTLGPDVDALDEDAVLNPKGDLQQLTQGLQSRPEYITIAEEGPEHDRLFTVEVRLGDEVLGTGSGASRQLAEKEAARAALDVLNGRSLTERTPDERSAARSPADAASNTETAQ